MTIAVPEKSDQAFDVGGRISGYGPIKARWLGTDGQLISEQNLPTPQDGMGASIRIFDVGSVTGYDMLRTLPSSSIMCLECAVRAGDLQRVVFTE